MNNIKQRWDTKHITDKVLEKDTKSLMHNIFEGITNIYLVNNYCSFTLYHRKYDSFPHNESINVDSSSKIDISSMSDREIVDYVRNTDPIKAQLVHDWLLANVFEDYPFIK